MPLRLEARVVGMWATALIVAAAGGLIAREIGSPLPWLIGAMCATAATLLLGVRPFGQEFAFPQQPRTAFIAIIGIAIGGSADPGMWAEATRYWMSMLAIPVFIGLAQVVNYQFFRRVAGYDTATAYYCATPGGLIESVQLGEEAGGDAALLTVQHFSRITITVVSVPFIYLILRGEAVGSAAGVSLDHDVPIGVFDVIVLVACGAIGVLGGRKIGLPAGIITGPILMSVLVHGLGITAAQPPDWLISVAQVVVGVGLAMRFRGLPPSALTRGMAYGAVTVAIMLSLGGVLAGVLSALGAQSFQVLFMCFAPGGVVEMGLIALSLGVSPLIVTFHHILRILVTVVAVPMAAGLAIDQPSKRD